MGWDAKVKRRLAVPIALRNIEIHDVNKVTKVRSLKHSADDMDELSIVSKLAENRLRIEDLQRSIELNPHEVDCNEIINELEFLRADIELGLKEVEAEIEDLPSSEDIVLQEVAFA
jgi:hypothetical protein